MPTVAFLVPASPTDGFYSQAAALAARLRCLPWSEWRPSVHLFVGRDEPHDPVRRWLPYLPDVEIVRTSAFRAWRHAAWAQCDDTMRLAPRDADVLITLDADTFPVETLEGIIANANDQGCVAGTIAHYPGFADPGDRSTRHAWARLGRGLLDQPLQFAHTHSLMDNDSPPEWRASPFYLNFGVVVFARRSFDLVAPRYLALRRRVAKRMRRPDFSGQVALALAIANARVPTCALPLRYNCPNDPVAEALYPEDCSRPVMIHYLRTTEFDRQRIFADPVAYRAFIRLPLTGVNRVFQEAVRSTFGNEYPFPDRR